MPVPDLISQFFVDEIETQAGEMLLHMHNNYYPYLMDYTETNENFGDIGDA